MVITDESLGNQVNGRRVPSDPVLIEKGKAFVLNVVKFSQKDEVKFATKTMKLTASMAKVAKVSDPKKGAIVVTSIAIQKAMLAMGLVTKAETKACVEAIGNLSADFGAAALLGPETAGIGAVLPLILAAVDSYDVGRNCFGSDANGSTTHAVVSQVRKDAKAGLKTTKQGPI